MIGITADYNDDKPAYHMNYAYCDAVSAAGGVPLVLPFRSGVADIPQILDLLDGIIFSGGDDLNPGAWGEEKHPKSSPINPDREKYERALIAAVEERRLPALGICLGSQLMNVHRGGTLRQFIPDLSLAPNIEHRKLAGVDGRHAVVVVPGSRLAEAMGAAEVESNSAHKQAYGKIGRGLTVSARAPDGIPEAVEDASMPLFLGVQWHPERIHTEEAQGKLFELLVRRAGETKRR